MSQSERHNQVGELVHRAVQLTECEQAAARGAFLRRLDGKQQPARAMPALRLAAGLAMAAAVLMLVVYWPRSGLSYSVNGAERVDGYVSTSGEEPGAIQFSDRTLLELAPGTQLRIDSDDPSGARVAVGRGQLDASVVHARGTDWRFIAGPFNVRVTGTRFTLSWNIETEQLEVLMHEGSVDIEGYAGSSKISVRAGQHFLGDARRQIMQVTDAKRQNGQAASTEAAPSASAKGPSSPAAADTASGTKPELPASRVERTSWTQLVAKGQFRDVVTNAKARGLDDCLSNCTAQELIALADAARYIGQAGLAEQVLIQLRARGGEHAARSAFLLGRVNESSGNLSRAQTWYETVLRESPGGAFFSDALAGKMRALGSLRGNAAARPVAREYLNQYPQGVHAEAAKKVLAAAD